MFAVLVISSFSFAEGRTQKKVPKSQKTAAEKASLENPPLHFLKFEQVAKLEYWQGVRYVKHFRKSLVAADELFGKFNESLPAYASIDPIKNQWQWEMLFGNKAYAAAGVHGRGSLPSDECIYAVTLQKWVDNNGRYVPNFGCAKPSDCSGSFGRGVACGVIGSGLIGSDACVPHADRLRSTVTCFDRVTQKINSAEGSQAVQVAREYEAYLKSNSANPEAILNDKTWTKRLAEYMWHPQVYMHLLKRADYFKKNGRKFESSDLAKGFGPTAQLGDWDEYGSFENAFNSLASGLEGVFGKFVYHCDKLLDKKVVEEIRSQTRVTPKWADREKQRKQWLEEEEKGGRSATVRSVLQKPECISLEKRIADLRRAEQTIADTYPCIRGDKDCAVGAPVVPPPPPPVRPDMITESVKSLGCESYGNETGIYQEGMRCVACAAERDVINTEQKDHVISDRWLSLLEVMAHACHETGQVTGKDVPASVAREYIETFGQCSVDEYNFSQSPRLDVVEKTVKQWSLKGIGDDDEPDKGDLFKKVYGLSFSEAKKIFDCEAKGKKSFFDLFKSTPKCLDGDLDCRRNLRRQSFEKNSKSIRNEADSSSYASGDLRKSLGQCMDRALELQKKLNPNGCRTVQKPLDRSFFLGRGSQPGYVNQTVGAVLEGGGRCSAARQLYQLKGPGKSYTTVNFHSYLVKGTGPQDQYQRVTGVVDNDFTYHVEAGQFLQGDYNSQKMTMHVKEGCGDIYNRTYDYPWRKVREAPLNKGAR